jgi:stringent starvation protein B
VSDIEQETQARVQAVLAELLRRQLNESLERVEDSLERWRSGELEPLEAHAEVLKHAVHTEHMTTRLVQASKQDARAVLRDALNAGFLDREEFVALAGVEPEVVEPAGSLDPGSPMPRKHEFVTALLEHGPVLVHMDARAEGVSVPERLQGEAKLVLRFGYSLIPPIHDLTVNETSLSGTLTFSGVPHHCVLPWSAVYAVVSEPDHQGMVWPEDVPEDVLAEIAGEADLGASGPVPATTKTPSQASSAKHRASHLKLVD